MLKIEFTGQFKKDYKAALKRGCDPQELTTVITLLASEQPLPAKYRDHALVNSHGFKDVRECHIKPDWLLIYKIYSDRLVLELIRTGTHSDLF
ncbi:MAG: type II toxin-antitoxin system YafQ family toxin [Clostridia bacterium]|nr:type II toxin-antitoxin system YafQ family toxin [Clostridia bacterium]